MEQDSRGSTPTAEMVAAGQKRAREDDSSSQSPAEWSAEVIKHIAETGGIAPDASLEDVIRTFKKARTSDQWQSCITILQTTADQAILRGLIRAGALSVIKDWIKRATDAKDVEALRGFLLVLLQLPVDVEHIKASRVGTYVARLSAKSSSDKGAVDVGDEEVRRLADEIVKEWSNAAKAAASSGGASTTSSSSSERKKSKKSDSTGSSLSHRSGDSSTGSTKKPRMVFLENQTGAAASAASLDGLPSLPSLSSQSPSALPALPAGPVALPSMDGLGAADVIIGDDVAVRADGDGLDWGGGVPPAEDPTGLVGISDAEMGGLATSRGVGLPERYGDVSGGILKNKVRGVAGGKRLTGSGRRITWVDTLAPEEAVRKHGSLVRAPADAFVQEHLVAVKEFRKDAEPIRVSTPVAEQRGVADGDLTAGLTPMAEDEEAAAPAADEDEETKHRRFAEAERRERAGESSSVKNMLAKVDIKALLSKTFGGVKSGVLEKLTAAVGSAPPGSSPSAPPSWLLQLNPACTVHAAWASPDVDVAAPPVDLYDTSHARPVPESAEHTQQQAAVSAVPRVSYAIRELIPPSPSVSHGAFLNYSPAFVPPAIPPPPSFPTNATLPARPSTTAFSPAAAAGPLPHGAGFPAPAMPAAAAAGMPSAAAAGPSGPAATTAKLAMLLSSLKAKNQQAGLQPAAAGFPAVAPGISPASAAPGMAYASAGMPAHGYAAAPPHYGMPSHAMPAAGVPQMYGAPGPAPYASQQYAPQQPETHAAIGPRPMLGRSIKTKPCLFFNTPRGCKNGDTCTFIHDPSFTPTVEELTAISARYQAQQQGLMQPQQQGMMQPQPGFPPMQFGGPSAMPAPGMHGGPPPPPGYGAPAPSGPGYYAAGPIGGPLGYGPQPVGMPPAGPGGPSPHGSMMPPPMGPGHAHMGMPGIPAGYAGGPHAPRPGGY